MPTHRLADEYVRSARQRLAVSPDATPRAVARAAWGSRPPCPDNFCSCALHSGYVYRYTMTLGERIKARRTELGLTQAQLAEKAGVRQPTLSNWESGAGSPQLAKLTSVAAALGVTLAELVAEDALADTLPQGAE